MSALAQEVAPKPIVNLGWNMCIHVGLYWQQWFLEVCYDQIASEVDSLLSVLQFPEEIVP